jgi:enamine deaminase RidA (YjgF/YER057c/UK114 family)
MSRQNFSSGSPFEPVVGYSRAVRVGNQIFITGTTAFGPEGKLVGIGDPYEQTVQVLHNIEAALKSAGAETRHVVLTRIFVTDISKWPDIGRAHKEFFGDILPWATMVEVSRLIDPDMLVEIEVQAVIHD